MSKIDYISHVLKAAQKMRLERSANKRLTCMTMNDLLSSVTCKLCPVTLYSSTLQQHIKREIQL